MLLSRSFYLFLSFSRFYKKITDISGMLPPLLPGCVKEGRTRADAEFFSWEAIEACAEKDFGFTVAI